MLLKYAKRFLIPNGVRACLVLRGPFRGARLYTNPSENLRKVLGLYEHELNDWLEDVLPHVDTVLDVGANDGYFTLGCAAVFRRMKRRGRIIAFEPQASCCSQIRSSAELQPPSEVSISIEQIFVGNKEDAGTTTLDSVVQRSAPALEPRRALVKIDVEGAEIEVIEGASCWLHPSNYFLIEVHEEAYLDLLKTRFAAAGLILKQRDQRPLPILGRERRSESNWWLVSNLS